MGCTESKVLPEPGSLGLPGDLDANKLQAFVKLNGDVEKYMSRTNESKRMKALFLGIGESGKSTIFKQLRLSYGDTFDAFERFQYSKLIWVDTLRAMRVLLDELVERGLDEEYRADTMLCKYLQLIQSLNLSQRVLIDMETDADARRFLGNYVFHPLNPRDKNVDVAMFEHANDLYPACDAPELASDRQTLATAISELWTRNKHVRALALDPSGVDLDTNVPYFFDIVGRMAHPSYLATDEDILRARIKTAGITATTFDVKGNELKVVDVGGQRTERKKWIHSFDDVTCLLFVVAASEYDQTLAEDGTVNRLEESLEVFQQVARSRWFSNKPIALFFNKMDVLEEKLPVSPFEKYFPDFKGDSRSSQEVVDYMEGLFRQRIKLKLSCLYCYRTCATDRQTMKFVVDAVTDMIFVENMRWAGLL